MQPTTSIIQITAHPIDWALRDMSDPKGGGVVAFYGVTREEKSPDGRDLIALDYEAYQPMADKQLQELAARAIQRWPIVKLLLVHRIGRVAVGEPSVVIAVACPHRGQAFEACRFLIDELKRDIAIWKKEIWSKGEGTWVHP